MWMFLLWWLVDDHLAAALNTPGLGTLPIWVPFIIALAFSTTLNVAAWALKLPSANSAMPRARWIGPLMAGPPRWRRTGPGQVRRPCS